MVFTAGRRQSPERIRFGELAERTVLTGEVDRTRLLILARSLPRAKLANLREAFMLELLLASVPPAAFGKGGAPLVFKSNIELAREFGCVPETISRILSRLFDAGLISFRDSGNYRRTGPSRNCPGSGIDLRILVARYDELQQRVEAADDRHRQEKTGRRRCNGAIRAALSWLAATTGRASERLARRLEQIKEALSRLSDPGRFDRAARAVNRAMARAVDDVPQDQKSSCMDDEIVIHQLNTNPQEPLESKIDRRPAHAGQPKHRPASGGQEALEESQPRPLAHVNLADLWSALPRLAEFGFAKPAHWRGFMAMAPALCRLAGIHDHARREAVEAMGEQAAAVAVALTVQRFADQTVKTPGGYLRALTERAGNGTLHLHRSIYALLAIQNRTAAK